jgi:hypothetical protein
MIAWVRIREIDRLVTKHSSPRFQTVVRVDPSQSHWLHDSSSLQQMQDNPAHHTREASASARIGSAALNGLRVLDSIEGEVESLHFQAVSPFAVRHRNKEPDNEAALHCQNCTEGDHARRQSLVNTATAIQGIALTATPRSTVVDRGQCSHPQWHSQKL